MSFCAENEPIGDAEYMRRFSAGVTKMRVPLCGSIALTNACNLRCVHCYCGPSHPGPDIGEREMTTGSCLRILDEIKDAGCLYLLLTGGEPLLRPDFAEIYSRAKKNGLMVTLFTNGTLIDDAILGLLGDLPPRRVEISLYGATAATHDSITASVGSFDACRNGIERLLDRGIKVQLKTLLMTRNRHEFQSIEKMAKDYGTPFRFDACIFPSLGGRRQPVLLRVSPDEIARTDFADGQRLESWREYYATRSELPPTARLYGCGAGVNSFWIDAAGNLQPCVMVRRIRLNIIDAGFGPGWKRIVEQMDATVAGPDFECNGCSKKALCGYCPGFFELESGSEKERSEFLCAVGQRRFELLSAGSRTEATTAR